ncbi:hypothetical protein SAMN05428979_2520 [Stappia sp. ES.058]|nr:hypothetical protein SAMN05428979_2520 [Stappia sp. ES.058]
MRRSHRLSVSSRGLAGIAGGLVLGAAVAACGHVPLTSMVKLRAFDLKTTDPEQLMVAVRHPDWIRIPPGGAVMVVERRGTPGGIVVRRDEIVFERVTGRRDLVGLSSERRQGATLAVFTVSQQDAQKLRAVQRRLAETRARPGTGRNGTLSISVTGCRIGPVRAGPCRCRLIWRPANSTGSLRSCAIST